MIDPSPSPSTADDPAAHLEKIKTKEDAKTLRENLREIVGTYRLRHKYATIIFALVLLWLLCVVGIVLMAGFSFHGFTLSDAVFIAFLSTTTVNVIGLFYVVAKWLFPSRNDTPPS